MNIQYKNRAMIHFPMTVQVKLDICIKSHL